MKNCLYFFGFLFLSGCASDAANPLALAPENPYSSWTPVKGSKLVSSKYCQTILPQSFGEEEISLGELLDIALQNNPSTKTSWANARANAAQYGQTMSAFYPKISSSNTFARQKGGFPIQQNSGGAALSASSNQSTPMGNTAQNNTSSSKTFYSSQGGPEVSLSYVLFDFGQRTASAMASREALFYADLNHNQEIQAVLQTVMDDYYVYVYQIALEGANAANLNTAQMSLDAANERFSLGLAALGDVATARTQFLQSRIKLNSQKQNVENAFAKLAVAIGLPANIRFQVQKLPEQVNADPVLEDVDALVALAQKQRQDLLAAEADIRSKEALLLKAKRARNPILSTNLNTGHYWFEKGIQEKGMHWTASFSLDFPLFDGFYLKNGVRDAEANLEAAKATFYQKELTLVQNVSNAHSGVKTSALNLSDSKDYLKAAELEFEIAIANYKAGTNTILDVMSAQSSLADARGKKALAEQNWFSSLALLAYATGSLCTNPNEARECTDSHSY